MGCSPGSAATVDWSAGPIKFSLSSNGDIEISGQRQWVTPMGTFSVGEEHGDEDGMLVLIIRHLRGPDPVDDVYTVPTSADVLIKVEGRTEIGIRGRTIVIDAIEAEIREITLTGVVWRMPDLVGADFQGAQDELDNLTNGIVSWTSAYDASGRARPVWWDVEWKVCTQSIPPGQQITAGSVIGFGIVKDNEDCPDGSVLRSLVWTVPSFVGMPLDEADDELQRLTSGVIDSANTHDATGAGRSQSSTADWVVCSQMPLPLSTATAHTPVEFGVVERGTACPATVY